MSKDRKSRNLFKRLTRLFRSGPVVKRKIVNVDNKYTATAFEAFRKNQSQIYSNAMSNYGTYDRMARYSDFSEMEYTPEISSALDIYCLAGDNVIPLMTGVNKTVKDLYDNKAENFYVYSYDITNNTYVPGLCKKVSKTGKDQKIYKVSLDGGLTLRLTGNHRVLLQSGEYVEVENLKEGDSVRSLHRKLSSKASGDRIQDYEMIKTNDKWTYTHRIVAEYYNPKDKGVVHHVDFRKWNNSPENLQFMTWDDHKELHSRTNTERWENNERYREKMSKIFSVHAKKLHAQPGWTKDVFLKRRNEVFDSYTEKERKEKFGRSCEQNGMYGSERFGSLNPRFNKNYKRIFTKKEIIDMIMSKKRIKDICKETPTSYDTLISEMKRHGINEFKTRNAVLAMHDKSKIISSLREFANKEGKKAIRKLGKITKEMGVERNHIEYFIIDAGYKNFKEFVNSNNHKVISVTFDGVEDVYDLTVDKYHNFAIGNKEDEMNFAIVHNSEEAIAADESGTTLHIFSENSKIKELLHELFYDTLNVEFNMSSWVRNLVKYGDHFMFNDVDPNYGVIAAYPLPISEVEREEGYDPNDPMAVRFRWIRENQLLENWQVSHMRLLANDAFLPYGSSVLEPARRIWRQLILLEDAMLIHRVVRAPGRRVFYIDVGNVPPEDVANYMEQAQTSLKRSSIVDKQTGKVDLRYNPISIDEDYFVPVRGSDSGTKIDTLEGTSIQGETSDVEYIQRKLFAALKIPKAYLGYDEGLGAKSTLSQEDVRFSRTIARIQRTVLAELNKIAIIHLYCNGYDGEDLLDFKLMLSNPSTIAQQQKLELWKQRFDAASSALGTGGVVDIYWVQKHLLSLSDDDIDMINKGRKSDKVLELEIESTQITSLEGPESEKGGMPQFDFDNVEGLPSASGMGGGPGPETSLPSLDINDMSEQSSLENEEYPIIVDSIMKNSLSILDEDDEKEDPPKKDDRSNKSYLRTGENTKLNVRNRDKLSNPGFDKLAYDRKQDIRPKISEDFDINEYLEAQTIYSARMTGQIKKTLDMLGNTDDIYKGSKPKNKSVIISENNSSGDEDDET